MGPLNFILWAGGILLIVLGMQRARRPWARYQELREQDANVERYAAWRGGVRDDGATGASVAMAILRRQARNGALIAGAGFVLVLIGFAASA